MGDCYGEGGNHLIHVMRRNITVKLFVHDNQIYGLTKRQASTTSMDGFENISALSVIWNKILQEGGSTMASILLYLLLGLVSGIFSGLIGIGGGTIIVPALVFLFGLSQHQAQGTTLALLVPPIGFLAAWTYYEQGYVDLKIAALICVGFFFGGLLGARMATHLSNVVLERVFGVALLLISLKMIFAK